MKKILLGTMAAMIAFSSIAQSNKKAENKKEFHGGGKHVKGNGNIEKLNLTSEQKAQMKTLNESFRQQMQDLKKNANLTAEQQKATRISLAKEHQQRIAALLTPEQKEQAKELRKDFKEDKKDNRRDGAKGKNFDKMTKELNLTPDQSNKMTALNESFKNGMKSIKDNSALSNDEKKAQMKNLQKQHRSDMQNLLTTDQKKQLKNHHKNRSNGNAVK